MKKRVIVYVDGFNFYFGLKAQGWKKYYWLDLVKFFSSFLPEYQELVQVNYFSAIPHHDGKQHRQGLLFTANKLNPKFRLHLGKFLKRKSPATTATQSTLPMKKKNLTSEYQL